MEITDLNDKQLAALKAGLDIEKVELHTTWSDDHILCASATFEFEDGTKIEALFLWWIGWEGVAALKYANESPTAMRGVRAILMGDELGLFDGNYEPDD